MNIKVKLLYPDAQTPAAGSTKSSGYDLFAYTSHLDVCIPPHQTVKIDTGISIEPDEGYYTLIYARSGLATKESLRPSNCVGVVDEDYRGGIIVALHNDSDEQKIIKHGQRIAQLVIAKRETANFIQVEELTETERGSGGFSSTGK